MKKIITLLALALPLMAAKCDFNDFVTARCGELRTAYMFYDEVAKEGVLSTSVKANVSVFRAQTNRACANPSSVTPAQMAGIAAGSYVALKAAFRQGQGEGDADEAATLGLEKIEALRAMLKKGVN